jgi:hypothetical protein
MEALMPRCELPGGGWVDYRDQLMAGDKFAVQNAVVFTIDPTGAQTAPAGVENLMRNALLGQIITAWSYEGIPVPSMNAGGTDVIGTSMAIDDYNHLADEVAPLLVKVGFNPNPSKSGS